MDIFKYDNSWTVKSLVNLYPVNGTPWPTIPDGSTVKFTPVGSNHAKIEFTHQPADPALPLIQVSGQLAINANKDEFVGEIVESTGSLIRYQIGIKLINNVLVGFTSRKTGSEDSGGTWTGN